MTFFEYVLTRKAGDNPRGDAIRDIKGDSRFPKAVPSWDRLLAHLRLRGACREAISEAEKLWKAYKKDQGLV